MEFGFVWRAVDLPPTFGTIEGWRIGRIGNQQFVELAAAFKCPAKMMPRHPGAVVNGQLDVIESIEIVGVVEVFEVTLKLLETVPPLGIGRTHRRFVSDGDG